MDEIEMATSGGAGAGAVAPLVAAGGAGAVAAAAGPPGFYGPADVICDIGIVTPEFDREHSRIANDPTRINSIYGDVLHDQGSNVNSDLGKGQTFTSIIQDFRANAGEIARMTTAGGNPTPYVLERGKTHPWNVSKIILGVFNNHYLGDLLDRMISLGIRNINVDCAQINLFERGLGDPQLNRVLYITNKFDAATNISADNLRGAGNLENNEPVTIELLPGYFFQFSMNIIDEFSASYPNRVLITQRTARGIEEIVDLRCNGPYSLGAINKFLELPPRRNVKEPKSIVKAVVEGTLHDTATDAEFTPLQKFLVMCVKEITDWGLAYKNSEVNFVNRGTMGACVLASFDGYFLDMMGQVCGYSLAVGPKTTELICYASCLATATINPYSNIYDNIVGDISTIEGAVANAQEKIDTRSRRLAQGNIYNYLEWLDLQYYSKKIEAWYGTYKEFVALLRSLIGEDGNADASKEAVIATDSFQKVANTFSELTFTTGSNYIKAILAEALGRKDLYLTFWNTIKDHSSTISVTRNTGEVREIIETIDTFLAETFKGYDSSQDLDILRAVLYSYVTIELITQDKLYDVILANCEGDLVRNTYTRAYLVHYALNKSGRPNTAGIATFFTNVGATKSTPKTDTSRVRPPLPVITVGSPDIFSGKYASVILESVSGIPVPYIAFTDTTSNLFADPPGGKPPKKTLRKDPKAIPTISATERRTIVTEVTSRTKKLVEAAKKREGAGAGAGAGLRAEIAERITAAKAAAAKKAAAKKRGGYYARGGGELTPENAESAKEAEDADYFELSEIPEIAAIKINEKLDKYRRGELTGKVLRQNADVNEFIQKVLSKKTTLVEVVGDILQLLLMLADEADNSNFYYHYLTAILELAKIYELYFSEGQEDIDIDDLINQVFYALFWADYTAVIVGSCINSSDVALIVAAIDAAYGAEITAEKPTDEVAIAPSPATAVNMQKKLKNTAYLRQPIGPPSTKPALPTKEGLGYRGIPFRISNLPKEPPVPAGAQLVFTGVPVRGGARRSRRRRSTPRRITRNKNRDRASRRRRTIRRRK